MSPEENDLPLGAGHRSAEDKLPRRIGLFDAASFVVGGIIGSGIFLTPGAIARSLPHGWMILSVWVITGLISFFGALAYAELGAMLPASGGQYVYLREAYGPLPAFLFNWSSFLIIQTGSIAALAVGFGIYAGELISLSDFGQKMVALGVILGLTVLNIFGVREAIWFQTLCTVLRVGGIAVVIVAAFLVHPVAVKVGTTAASALTAGAVAAAVSGCFWTYEGWYILGFIAGEVKESRRNIPVALTMGMTVVVGLYVLANIGFLHALPVSQLAATDRVASAVTQSALGRAGAVIVTLSILISMAGCNNAGVFSAPRLYYALAQDGLFFRAIGKISERWQTPINALVLQAVWAVILTLSGSYEVLYNYIIFASWLFYALAVGGVFVLRRRRPDWERPYQMWGYPVTPALFVLFALWFLVSTFWSDARPSLIGVGIVIAGVPVYFLWRLRGGGYTRN